MLALLSASVSPLASTYNLSYDELGRLVGVVDDGGNTAAYNYDALGNIVSIGRGNSAVSIVSFSPGSGPVGANVTIAGAGFSATASQNTVAFNGTAATIVSATTNQLVVTVPAGATTGPISVASPAGSATSTSTFSIISGQAPTITSFSPTIGVIGTTVSIAGTNFQTRTIDNSLVLNTRGAQVSTATMTAIGTTVPPLSTSGRFTVTTPYGQATSGQDFFVPPGTHVAGDVGVTGRMAIGSTQTVTLGAANKIGMMLFDATAGQRASLLVTSSSFGSCSSGTIQILNVDGTVLGTTNLCNGNFLSPVSLPVTASFTIVVSPSANTTGSVTFSLNGVPPDPTATITPGGPAVTLGTTTAGQKMSLTFSGTAGQRVSLLTSNSSFPGPACLWGSMFINSPSGAQLAGWDLCSNRFLGAITLPTTGTYTIAVYPYGMDTGTETFQLYNVPLDSTATITPGGSPVTLGTTVPGQNMSLTFSGTAGQRVSLLTSNSSFPGCRWASLFINSPDGSHLAGTDLCSNEFLGAITLPTTGTYTIAAYPNGTATGSETFQLYNVPSDSTATITPGGSPVTLGTTVPGQNMSLTFSGTASQRVSLLTSNSSFPGCRSAWLYMNGPDGSHLAGTDLCSNEFLGAITLPSTGTYAIVAYPGAATGSETFQLYDVPLDPTATITPGGSPVTLGTTVPGQNMSLTFSGTAGQRVSLLTSNSSFPGCRSAWLYMNGPDGSHLAGTDLCSNEFLGAITLPSTGTYAIVAYPGAATGSETFQLYDVPPDPTATITLGGSPVTLGTTVPGQKMSLTFSGTTGQQVSIVTTNSNFPTCGWGTVLLRAPNGSGMASSNLCSNATISTVSLSASGTYTIGVTPAGTDTGSATFTLNGQ
ncbi:TPA: IPT/TIG domain-containing protein [Burkholderia ambifaria]|uniref:IPT/TIG domain-containing protein n=1 Tax=Burkholderia ambifaria TaxID=152480 RepID=UPI001F1C7110|nr:IPT/TIG domain-containing protein [Burkholderia ambifaria]